MKKEQIIQSARKLFTKYGFKKVSMNEIAEDAGVTKKTIYSYFIDKEDLLKYFLLEEIQKMKEIAQTIEEKKLGYVETIHQTLYELLKMKKQDKFLIEMSHEAELTNSNVVKDCLKLLDTSIREYIENKLNFAVEHDYINIENVQITAFLIYKLYIALMFEWDEEANPLNEKEISDNIIKVMKNGILKTKGSEAIE